jgi:TIR domain
MDVGQMGGGDKLYAKIDKGIRAAKVIVCCVTEKYAESPNCNREVHI